MLNRLSTDAAYGALGSIAAKRAATAAFAAVDPAAAEPGWSLPSDDTLLRVDSDDLDPVYLRVRVQGRDADEVTLTVAQADAEGRVRRVDDALAIGRPIAALNDDTAMRQAVASAARDQILEQLLAIQV